jgi:hypothetical protein
MKNITRSPAFTQPPYYVGESVCEGVYGGEKHYAILADRERGIVADIEGGLTPDAKRTAEFLATAGNCFADLVSLAGWFKDACSDRIEILEVERREVLDLTQDPECADDIDDQIGHWKAFQNECDSLLAKAHGTAI